MVPLGSLRPAPASRSRRAPSRRIELLRGEPRGAGGDRARSRRGRKKKMEAGSQSSAERKTEAAPRIAWRRSVSGAGLVTRRAYAPAVRSVWRERGLFAYSVRTMSNRMARGVLVLLLLATGVSAACGSGNGDDAASGAVSASSSAASSSGAGGAGVGGGAGAGGAVVGAGGGGGAGPTTPCWPFDAPALGALRASPKKVFAHYFSPYPNLPRRQGAGPGLLREELPRADGRKFEIRVLRRLFEGAPAPAGAAAGERGLRAPQPRGRGPARGGAGARWIHLRHPRLHRYAMGPPAEAPRRREERRRRLPDSCSCRT